MTTEAVTVEAPPESTGLGVWEYEGGHLVEHADADQVGSDGSDAG